MKNHWRKLFSFLPKNIERNLYQKYFEKEHRTLLLNQSIRPASNLTKQQSLKTIKIKYSIKTFIETGTYLGDTLYSLYNDFEKLYSIELSDYYYKKALNRFRNYKKITLIHGDSGQSLYELMPKLKEPSLFWLDGHYSGGLTAKGDKECPVYEELNAIFSSPINHIVVIDDARLFTNKNDYPSLRDLEKFVKHYKPEYTFKIENDSIKLLP